MDTAPDRAFDELFGTAGIAPMRLGHAVIEKLTAAIMDGRLKPGDALPSEGRIAEACGISKQIAREAIRDLAAMGVVHIQQGKVARVRTLDAEPLGRFFRFAVRRSKEGLAEAVEFRQVIEPTVARLAAIRRTNETIGLLETTLRRMEATIEDIPAWIEADLDFHEAMGAVAGNRLLHLQLRGLRPVIREVMELFNARRQRPSAEWRETYQRHVAVFTAVASGDAQAASDAMAQHLYAADGAIQEIFPRGT